MNFFSRSEVSNILGIKINRLHYWDRIGLVSPSLRDNRKSLYAFQDLICLKTAQGLIDRGLGAKKIKESIESLKTRIPELDGKLNSKRIYVFGNRVIISHKSRLIDTQSGQFFFKFDVDDISQKIDGKIRHFETKSAGEWFRQGLSYDSDESTYELALEAYRHALRLDPALVDAYVNMGNVYYNRRKLLDAERCYRLAINRDPYHSKAHFNLGNVMDDLNCCEEAIHCYEKSLEVDPEFPDAYFNMAATCEKLSLWDKAIKYWKGYLNFDPDSRHGRVARKRMKLLRALTADR
ncbi:MAG: tetratricopeptide repeat protein [Acidobacteriota bacterium]